MLKKNVVVEDEPASAVTTDLGSKIKQEEMKQAVAVRFQGSTDLATPSGSKKRSPYWQPADDQC
ncbi:MAG TPA: hypothetical protein VKV05_09500 [Terriglobales bacterium]|nr:hypothetical protein [Terriglobales bacterium]